MNTNKKYKRIISLVPSQTELLVDLGLEDNILGITKFCVHPTHLTKTKTIVGGTKNIKIDKIKELQPDIILCNREENTKEIVEACQQVAFTHVSDIFTLTDSIELISLYGSFFEKQIEAKKITNKLESKIIDFKKFIKNKKSRKVAYFIWRNPWMVAASNTFINHLLELNKFENVYANEKRYPEVDIKNINKKKPELILLSSEPFPFKEKHILEIIEHTNNLTPILVDGEYFSWYGSRLLKAFDYFKELHNRA
ncbi:MULTISPECIES: ABC transporter substrate-binding protein [Tenacibaculum]|uniref:Cobalamin-binding protein n=1 Tax=Tenacibaculum mesophilum TaxID=104268 RepID=A0ABN5TB29_9FLAO|nr:helical backbone metal receptor [Tenacibaculum mesophilum]AZJ33719.1 cobalamin-binding protein [Tenacibaculum mesophilum]QFS28962.1 ABC transporter substrate-binding protein [Tenacibaculum mesophilum]BFF35367.1 helical backbone metal receptor [Tenacibaculum mesophilum]SHF54964.1 substrate-binding protein [Tenacibaculum mesophilum]